MMGFQPENPRKINDISRVFALNKNETIAAMNLRLMERDSSDSIRLRDHLKLLSKSAASVQHRLILAANGNARERAIGQKQLANSIAMLTGVIAQLDLLSTDLPVEIETLEQGEENRLNLNKDRNSLEASLSADAATTANVPVEELTERKRGRRPKQKLEGLIQLYSDEEQDSLERKKSALTLQEKVDTFY